jgi:hypothetical protein
MTSTTEIRTLSGAATVTLGTVEDALAPTSLRAQSGHIVATYFDGTETRFADFDDLCARGKLADVGDAAVDAEADAALAALEVARVRSTPMAERITSIRYELSPAAARELGAGDVARGVRVYEAALDALLPNADVTVVASTVDASRFDAEGEGFVASKRHLGGCQVSPTDPDGDELVGARDGEAVDAIVEQAWQRACESTAD